MKYKVVCVYDSGIESYAVPAFVMNVAGAIRSFGDECKRPGSDERPNQLNLHPDSFSLFLLGEFDDSTGEFSCGKPSQIATAREFVRKV